MITKELLSKCLDESRNFWKSGDVEYLHRLNALLDACGEDDDDCVRDIIHICAHRHLDLQQAVDMLVIAQFDVEV